MKLFSYKVVVDTGFAPNPFGHTLTLATCKPQIRRCKDVGAWIAGFTSKGLNGDPVGDERLLFLMLVGEKQLIGDYFFDKRFQGKIPDTSKKGPLAKAGDNIYRPIAPNAFEPDHFEQVENPNHNDGQKIKDISGQWVLIAKEFYYFGRSAITIPTRIRPSVPIGQSAHGNLTRTPENFIQFIRNNYSIGRHGMPFDWPDDKDPEPRSYRKCS